MISCFLTHVLIPNITVFILVILMTSFISTILIENKFTVYLITLVATLTSFLLSSIFLYTSNVTNNFFLSKTLSKKIFFNYDVSFTLSTDSLSMYFLVLTCFIFPFCIFGSYSINNKHTEFISYLILLEIFLIISFTTTNLITFYVFFEAVLIPIFIIIGKWGSRERRVKAAFYLFLYTLFGSFFLLWGIYYLYVITGSVSYELILQYTYSSSEINYLWILFFVPFGIKIPMYPTHIWLPEAHVEAPTIGSVLLASLLLKLGGYGFLRVLIPITNIYTSMLPFVYSIGIAGVVFSSLSTIRQIDLKKIIAYSSVAHMNLIVLGLFSNNIIGVYGAVYLMIAHAFVSSGLFFCIGVLYDRFHTRLIRYYGGLVQVMPVFSTCFFVFTLSNISFPGTANFIGEFLILSGLLQAKTTLTNFVLLPSASFGIILSSIYSIWVFNKIIFGTIKTKYICKFTDLDFKEMLILSILIFVTIVFGVNSSLVFFKYTN